MDYSEYMLRIGKLMQEVHKAAQARKFDIASDLAAEAARYAINLSASLELETEKAN